MCTQLITLVSGVLNILPEIEAFRPSSAGIKALCSLNKAKEKAKLLVESCSDSSKLYLVRTSLEISSNGLLFRFYHVFDGWIFCINFQALTGDVILSRCIKSKNLLVQSLSELQTMVPLLLAAKVRENSLPRSSFSIEFWQASNWLT